MHIESSDQDSESSKRSLHTTQKTYKFFKRTRFVEVFPLIAIFLLPFFAQAGVFSAFVNMIAEEPEPEHVSITYNPQTIPLLKAAVHPDPNPSKGGGDILVDEGGALVPNNGPAVNDAPANTSNGEISVYVVRPDGDTLSQIAEMFDVTPSTILWANDIKDPDIIQPGDELVILPISGVRHVVKDGDTLKAIAKKYEGDVDDIISYNGLADASDIAEGDTVVIPGGEVAPPPTPKSAPRRVASSPTYAPAASGYYAHPVPGAARTQGIHGYNGVDFGAPAGTPIRAAAAGDVILVRSSGWNGGYGKYVVVRHGNGTQTLYAHNSSNIVSIGQKVAQGQVIGYIGSTGRSTGNHLHFEVRGARNPF